MFCAALALSCSSQRRASSPDVCSASEAACGVACNSSHPCASGLYCGADQLCRKDCDGAHACPSSSHCGSDGRCANGAPATQMPPPSSLGDASIDNPRAIVDAGPLPDSGYLPSDACQVADVSSSRVIPTVVLVIDQSGSMNDNFGSNGGTRWTVLRDFLLKSDGLIASLQSQVSFGLAMYSAMAPDANGQPDCPIVTSVAPALNNFNAIDDVYSKAMPISDTPTGDAIDKIVAGLPKPAPDQPNPPQVLILATDGEPDRCEELNPQNGQAEAVAAVQHAFDAGIRTFIISVGDEVSMTHQQDVANAGLGHKAGDPDAPYWNAGDDTTLRSALTDIIGAQVSCDVTLKGKVQSGDPCDGQVQLNGKTLTCKGADGWELIDATHIRLDGQACTDFKTMKNATVHATFPCSVQVVF
ncbi:MAG TPA: vWA domain-containing protein [Polyangiales bacterium]|nr:vWA domain-containing protein [Polyangiales bacterium]